MTSSLVGSEMCIRDRSMTCGLLVWPPSVSRDVRGAWVLRICRPPLMCRGIAAGVSARAEGCLAGGAIRWSLAVWRYV
eukprot:5691425-Prorocentrum_lima.AAC.1